METQKSRRWWGGFTCPGCERDFIQPVFLAQDEARYCVECELELMIEHDIEHMTHLTELEETDDAQSKQG